MRHRWQPSASSPVAVAWHRPVSRSRWRLRASSWRPDTALGATHAVADAAGGIIDDGIALFFAALASFTGEDVLETARAWLAAGVAGDGAPLAFELGAARRAGRVHPTRLSERKTRSRRRPRPWPT